MDILKQHLAATQQKASAFAKRCNISASMMSKVINGVKQPSLELAIRIEDETLGLVPCNVWRKTDEDAQ